MFLDEFDDFDMDEPLTCAIVAERTGMRPSIVMRLVRRGLLETVSKEESESGEPILPRRTIMQLGRMQRLHRDLGVNFAGAAVILDLVARIRQLNSELANYRERRSEEIE